MTTQIELLPDASAEAGSGAAVRVQPVVSPAVEVTDLDIVLFAAQHVSRVQYGSPTIVHWFDSRGDHTTTGEDTRSATINALLEWREQG